jgi:outer membrane murein-binding lipoprotein Lpp
MRRITLAIAFCALSTVARAADDLKVSQLELDVRNLQREVNALSRELEQLRSQIARPADSAPLGVPVTPRAPGNDLWLQKSRWQQVRTGMTELEVIGLLGPPASMRMENQGRVLMYAMEIGSSGFLSGSVTLREGAVVDVKLPVLK